MFKHMATVTKILYLLAFILFLVWVIPTIIQYYSSVGEYKNSVKKIEQKLLMYGLNTQTREFSKEALKQTAQRLFSKVSVQSLENNKYLLTVKMKKEDFPKFQEFLETISLRFYVQVVGALDYKINDDEIVVKVTLLKL